MTFNINGKTYSIATTISDYCGVEILEQLTASIVNQKRFDKLHRLVLEDSRRSLPATRFTWLELDYTINPIAVSNATITIFGTSSDDIGADDYVECVDTKLNDNEKDMFTKMIEQIYNERIKPLNE